MKRTLGVLLFLFSIQSFASLVQWDAYSGGDELAVRDLSTGLVWLDLTETVGLSYNSANAKFDARFAGWEYASAREVRQLFNTVFPTIEFSGDLGSVFNFQEGCLRGTLCYEAAEKWHFLFGTSFASYSYGLYEDADGILRMGGSFLAPGTSANLYGSEFNPNYNHGRDAPIDGGTFSIYLVNRDNLIQTNLTVANAANSVNEPGSGIILLACFLVFMSYRHFRFR